jgi:hypothetical protein
MKEKNFGITQGKGFHITFENGYTVSVQFGYGNYCDNRDVEIKNENGVISNDAECAAWNKNGDWVKLDEYDNVKGYMSPKEVLALMNKISKKK